ncbi:tyrosyl-tRNA synthetase [compost metagenome]
MLVVPAEGVRLGAACTEIGFTASNGEAKRKIAEGAVRLDDEAVTDPGLLVQVSPGRERKLSLGRKRHGILRSA